MAELPRIEDIIKQCGLEGEDAELFWRIALNRLASFSNAALIEAPAEEGEMFVEDVIFEASAELQRLDEEYDELLPKCSRQVLRALEVYLRAFLPEDVLARVAQAS